MLFDVVIAQNFRESFFSQRPVILNGALGDLDLALTSTQVSEPASIDALTPRVRDLTINIR